MCVRTPYHGGHTGSACVWRPHGAVTCPAPWGHEHRRLSSTLYGAAVDADDDVYMSQLQGGKLLRVNIDDFTIDTWDVPGE